MRKNYQKQFREARVKDLFPDRSRLCSSPVPLCTPVFTSFPGRRVFAADSQRVPVQELTQFIALNLTQAPASNAPNLKHLTPQLRQLTGSAFVHSHPQTHHSEEQHIPLQWNLKFKLLQLLSLTGLFRLTEKKIYVSCHGLVKKKETHKSTMERFWQWFETFWCTMARIACFLKVAQPGFWLLSYLSQWWFFTFFF